MDTTTIVQKVDAVRHFNRFYTQQIGVLADEYLDSPFSVSEARVIYELAQHETTTATELGQVLGLDAGYLSRILRKFTNQGLLQKQPSPTDGRQSLLRLSGQGQAAFAALNERSHADFERLLGTLSAEDQHRLVAAMQTVERLLVAQPAQNVPYMLRPHQPGDMGWVVHRHGVLYAQEYGWDEQFEALVATIVAEFIQHFDPKHERCWMVEMDGEIVGSVFLVKKSDTVAKLRLLLIEPHARGLGIGKRLVDECIRFARQAGYSTITLWTNNVLVAARRIYQHAGFQLVHEEAHHSFGHDLVGETWERTL